MRNQGRGIVVKPTVVKGGQNYYSQANIDANSMAQIEAQKMIEHELAKKERIESFMNSTRMNASKLQKQKAEQSQQKELTKKELLERQKQLKSKYTVVPKKSGMEEKVQSMPKEPVHVNWKQAEDALRKVQIPEEKLNYDSSGDESGYDSEVDPQKNENPKQVLEMHKKIRQHMLTKLKR